MKKAWIALMFIALFGADLGTSFGPLSSLAAQADAAEAKADKASEYVGSKTTKIAYKASCAEAAAIPAAEKVTLKNKGQAKKEGYKITACK